MRNHATGTPTSKILAPYAAADRCVSRLGIAAGAHETVPD
jgi:hypothetical protein